jgi:hypothetical protein
MFQKLDIFLSSGERGDIYSVGPLKKNQHLQSLDNLCQYNYSYMYQYLRPGYVKGRQ